MPRISPAARKVLAKTRRTRRKKRFQRFVQGAKKALPVVAKTAGTALAIAESVASLINVEFKLHEQHFEHDASTTAEIEPLTEIAEGDDYNTRDGRSIHLKSIYMKCYMNWVGAADPPDNTDMVEMQLVRLMLVMDRHGAGSYPSQNELQESAGVEPLEFSNWANTDRFHIMYDKCFCLDGFHPNRFIKKYIPCDIQVKYRGTAGAEASVDENWIYFVVISNMGGVNKPYVVSNFRLSYLDN